MLCYLKLYSSGGRLSVRFHSSSSILQFASEIAAIRRRRTGYNTSCTTLRNGARCTNTNRQRTSGFGKRKLPMVCHQKAHTQRTPSPSRATVLTHMGMADLMKLRGNSVDLAKETSLFEQLSGLHATQYGVLAQSTTQRSPI